MTLQDWASIFQLACGFNLVLGSYTGTRKEREDFITQLLDDANTQINSYCEKKEIDLKKCTKIRNHL